MSAEQPFNPEQFNPTETPEFNKEVVKNEVARVFILQSRSEKDFKDLCEGFRESRLTPDQIAEKLGSDFLTHSLWLKKNSKSRNPGQILPVGGGQTPQDRGDIVRTATRESLEEIHVRPTEMHRLRDRDENDLVIHYEQTIKQKDKQEELVRETNMHLFAARILPTDVPHQQNEEEDKIDAFPRLSLMEKGELWGKNTLKKDDSLHLLDSLQVFPEDKKGEKIDLKFPDKKKHAETIAETMNALGVEARRFEVEKQIDVARELVRWVKSDSVDLGTELQALENCKHDLPKAQVHYQTILRECAKHIDLVEWFPHAVERSNFKEELRNPGNSQLEGAIRFAFLMARTSLSLAEIVELKTEIELENGPPRPSSEYFNLIDFLKKIIDKKDDGLITDEEVVEYARDIDPDEIDLDEFYDDFAKRTGIKDLANKSARIDKFLVSMFQLGVAKDGDAVLDPERGGPLTNVAGPNIEKLLLYAFEQPPVSAEKANFLSPDSQMRLRFEALRKLFLLSALEPASQRYSQAEKLGNGKIEELWNAIFFIDKSTESVPATGEKQNLAVGTRYMRGFKEISGLLVSQETRQKQIDSYFRKIILRGFDDPEELWDIYGRSLILDKDSTKDSSVTDSLFTREEFTIETYDVTDDKKLVPHTKIVSEYPAVINIIKQLQAQGAKIVDYDPTNIPGTSFNSAGPGGGDKITMAKFYICLENQTARGVVRRFEEVQVFSPTEDGRSGFENKDIKNELDRQRAVRRLLETKGLRSFIELMFPVGIYGDVIHQLYQKNNSGH